MVNGHTDMVLHEESCENCQNRSDIIELIGLNMMDISQEVYTELVDFIEKRNNECFNESLEGRDEDASR